MQRGKKAYRMIWERRSHDDSSGAISRWQWRNICIISRSTAGSFDSGDADVRANGVTAGSDAHFGRWACTSVSVQYCCDAFCWRRKTFLWWYDFCPKRVVTESVGRFRWKYSIEKVTLEEIFTVMHQHSTYIFNHNVYGSSLFKLLFCKLYGYHCFRCTGLWLFYSVFQYYQTYLT